MISPQEIKEQGLKWWKPFLQSHLKGEVFFETSKRGSTVIIDIPFTYENSIL